jgi:hypothetical protein
MKDDVLTMLDYIKRTDYGKWNDEAKRLLTTLPWPTEPCQTCGQFPPAIDAPKEK